MSSSSSFNVIRRNASNSADIRLKELTQELAKQRSELTGTQLETDDVRSQGRMDHSTIKVNDERLKFVTTLASSNTDFFYEFPTEPDFNYLKVWFMLDHLGARMRDMSGLGNDAYIQGHPTLRRSGLDLGFQQTAAGGGLSATPVMLFNSGTDVVSQKNGEYIWIPNNPSIQFSLFSAGFSITFRFNCLDFNNHTNEFGTNLRRFAAKTDDALNGWNLVVYPTNAQGTTGGVEMNIVHDGVTYKRRTTGYNSNSYYQVIVTYNPNVTADLRIKIYTGGIENSIAGITSVYLPTQPNLRIGARDSEAGFFYGYLHDFRLYMGKVLTQAEVTNLNTNEMSIDNIQKGRMFIVQYALISGAMRSKRHRYNVGGYLIRTKIHKFNVTRKLVLTHTHKFVMVKGVSRTRTHKFTIPGYAVRNRTHKFSMGGHLTKIKTHKFSIIQKITQTKTHKYSSGGLSSQYLRFQKSTTAGSNIVQDVVFTGKPQAIICWTDGSTSDNTFTDGLGVYYGFSDGTNNACISAIARDNQATSDTFSGLKNDKVIALSSTITLGTVAAEATVSFIDTNTARFTWTTNDTRPVYIHCLALWGFNNAEVKTFTAGTTSIGNQTYSLNNTNMTPTILNTINNSTPVGWDTTYGAVTSIGLATSPLKQYSVGFKSRDTQLVATNLSVYDTTKVLVGIDDDSMVTPIEAVGSLASIQTGSFTINWTDAPVGAFNAFSVLVLDAPNVDIGTFNQPTTTPQTQIINVASNLDAVKGVMIFNNNTVTSGTGTAAMSIGGGSGTGSTSQGLTVVREMVNSDPTVNVSQNKTGTITKTVTATATATSSTTSSEGALSNLGTDQFTINWTTLDANARIFFYMVFG